MVEALEKYIKIEKVDLREVAGETVNTVALDLSKDKKQGPLDQNPNIKPFKRPLDSVNTKCKKPKKGFSLGKVLTIMDCFPSFFLSKCKGGLQIVSAIVVQKVLLRVSFRINKYRVLRAWSKYSFNILVHQQEV